MMNTSTTTDEKDYYPIIIVKNSTFKLSIPSRSLSSSTEIEKWKDNRLELVNISKGLIEVLHDTGFTVEKILDAGPSKIAEKIGIDDYVAQIIFNETRKAISK